jgi:hypothetical protein
MSGHPSEPALERFSVDDLAPAAEAEIAAHVAECAACRGLLDELERARAARLAAAPPDRFVARVAARRARTRTRRLISTGMVAFAAAAALLLMLRPRPDVRLKGVGVVIQCRRDAEVHVLGSDEKIRAGDRLRVVVTRAEAGAVAAWFVDDHGRVDALLPEPAQLAAGEQALPGSAIVEAPCIDSWLVVATGEAANARVEATLRAAVAHGVPAGTAWLPVGAFGRRLQCE